MEVITNHHLAMAGIEERIDCRSYREQGIQKLPTVKLGQGQVRMNATV